jgi:hypothetical protein
MRPPGVVMLNLMRGSELTQDDDEDEKTKRRGRRRKCLEEVGSELISR